MTIIIAFKETLGPPYLGYHCLGSAHTHTRARTSVQQNDNFGNEIHKLYILRGVNLGGLDLGGFPRILSAPEGVLKCKIRDGTMERDPVQV